MRGTFALFSSAHPQPDSLVIHNTYTYTFAHTGRGVGFGLASVLLMYGRSLELSLGPGTLYTEACSGMSFFLSSALHACLMLHLNVFLMVSTL